MKKLANHLQIDNFRNNVPLYPNVDIKGLMREEEQGFIRKGILTQSPHNCCTMYFLRKICLLMNFYKVIFIPSVYFSSNNKEKLLLFGT